MRDANYISVDRQSAINSYGNCFKVGDVVTHDDTEAGEATILYFKLDIDLNEITAVTDKGWAHIDFMNVGEKIRVLEQKMEDREELATFDDFMVLIDDWASNTSLDANEILYQEVKELFHGEYSK